MVEKISFTEQITKNKLKSSFLLIGIFAILMIVGYIIALLVNPQYFFPIMAFASVFSIGYILVSYYNSDNLAVASVRARPADPIEHAVFLHVVQKMARAANLPTPKSYVMQSEQINAFAAGRNPKNAVICVTTGCIRKLNKEELEGVVAHEMAHIAQFDTRLMTIAAVVVGLVSIVAEMFLHNLWFSGNQDEDRGGLVFIVAILVAIIAPIIAHLVSLAISRKREFIADATAVKFTNHPRGLRNALIKIRDEHVPVQDQKRYTKAMAPLFISDPYKKRLQNLFTTHPSIHDRINILDKMI